MVQLVKKLPAVQETWVRSLGLEDPLKEEMATHSSILAWRIPWPEDPGGLQSMRSQSHTQLRQLRMQACTVETKETNDNNKKCLEWTLSLQASLAMGFSRQEYWRGLPFPPPGHLPDPGIESRSPELQADSLPSEPPRKQRKTNAIAI